jgi:hypothetical protein
MQELTIKQTNSVAGGLIGSNKPGLFDVNGDEQGGSCPSISGSIGGVGFFTEVCSANSESSFTWNIGSATESGSLSYGASMTIDVNGTFTFADTNGRECSGTWSVGADGIGHGSGTCNDGTAVKF